MEPSGPVQACTGITLLFISTYVQVVVEYVRSSNGPRFGLCGGWREVVWDKFKFQLPVW
jgi:hypothetical protein